jgi:VanZ family protein
MPALRWDRRWIGVFAGYLAVIAAIDLSAYLGIIPTSLRAIPYYDTFGHLFLIGLAGFLTHRAMARRTLRVAGLALPLGILIVAVLAGGEELLQLLSSRREASVWDYAADLVGLGGFWALDAWLARKK